MPDIRRTPLLDDFNRADENPLSGGGNWAQAHTDPLGYPLQLRNVGHSVGPTGRAAGSTQTFRDNWTSYWTPQAFSGPMEIWGLFVISADAGDRAGLALWNGVGGGAGALTGYLLQIEAGSPADGVHLYRLDNDTGTHMVPVFGYTPDPNFFETLGHYMLRLTATDVEVWYSTAADAGSAWSMLGSVADTTYRTDLSLVLNMFSGGDNPGWDSFGGGAKRRFTPDYYRRRS